MNAEESGLPRDDRERSFNLYRPISGPWFLFCLLAGLLDIAAVLLTVPTFQTGWSHRIGEVIVFVLALGLGAALIVGVILSFGNGLRKAVPLPRTSSPMNVPTDSGHNESQSNSSFSTFLDSSTDGLLRWTVEFFRQIAISIRKFFGRTAVHSLWIGWYLVGGFDLLVAISATFFYGQIPFGIEALIMSLISFVASHCIYVRQNFVVARAMSLVGLLPITLVAWFRIPLSIATLLWLRSPATRDSFENTPWPETRLGGLVNTYVSPLLRK